MKRVVVTTVTSLIDVDTGVPSHSIGVDDQDRLAEEVSPHALADLLRDVASSLLGTVNEQFPAEPIDPKPIDPEPVDPEPVYPKPTFVGEEEL